MGVSFVCPNCNKNVDPLSTNATMSAATKRWEHKDCSTEPERKVPPPSPPTVDRRRKPRR
jgi:hypothetical protein